MKNNIIEMWRARRANAARPAWTKYDITYYPTMISGFPPRPAHPEGWQYGKGIADRYWIVMLDRKELAYTTTPTLTDYMNFEKRMR